VTCGRWISLRYCWLAIGRVLQGQVASNIRGAGLAGAESRRRTWMERDREEVFDRNRGYVQEAEADADGEEMGDGDSMAGEAAEVRAVIRKGMTKLGEV
jgi:hypothetical protein